MGEIQREDKLTGERSFYESERRWKSDNEGDDGGLGPDRCQLTGPSGAGLSTKTQMGIEKPSDLKQSTRGLSTVCPPRWSGEKGPRFEFK